MASSKISELTALGATPADDDVLAIVDTSASATKKVTVSDLLSGAGGFDPNVDNPTIGNGASAGADGVAIGHDTTCGSFGAVAIGQNSNATGNSSVGIGNNADTSGLYAISIGSGANASTDVVAIGRSASGSVAEGIAIGTSATSSQGSAISIGSYSDATAASSVALGREAQATGSTSAALGERCEATGSKDIAVGSNVQVNGTSGFQNTAIGSDVTFGTSTVNNIAIGHGVSVPNGSNGNIYIGYEASSGASNGEVVAIGYQTTTSGDQQVSIGNQASGSYGASVGYRTSGGIYSTAVGHIAQATGNYGIGIGSNARANFANTIHMNATSGSTTNAPTADGHMVIETDDAKIEYNGNWDMSGGTLTLGAVTYPSTDGTANQVLTTDGSGTLSFADAGGGLDGFDTSAYTGSNGIFEYSPAVSGTQPRLLYSLSTSASPAPNPDSANSYQVTYTLSSNQVFGFIDAGGFRTKVYNRANGTTASTGLVLEGPTNTDSGVEIIGNVKLSSLPTTDPSETGLLWNDGGTVVFSGSTAGGGFDPAVDNPAIGNGSSTGTNSAAYGHDATASGTSAVAIGLRANVGSATTSSVAIGTDTDATADSAVAIGVLAQATATYGIAIGQQAAVSNAGGVSIGYASSATTDAVAVGRNADATTDAISIGANSDASATRSIAVGHEADALATESIAIGDNANTAATATAGIAIGDSANANAANTIHINASGASTNAPATAGYMVIETDDAKIEFDGAWSMTGGNFEIYNSTAPTASVTDGVILYAEDVSASSELKVRDEAGNVTTLSPHNFELIPEGPSEDMAWSYYSEKDGKRINVDMLKAIRVLESMSGEQLVFEG